MEKRSPLPRFLGTSGVRQDSSPPSADDAANAGQSAAPRNTYHQRIDQLKIRIAELSLRNMENTLRILRTWMKQV